MRVRPYTMCDDDLTFIADSSIVSRLAPPQIVEYLLMNDWVRINFKIVIFRAFNTSLSLTGGLAAYH